MTNYQKPMFNYFIKLTLILATSFFFINSGLNAKEADKTKAAVIKAYKESIQDTPLQGKIIGVVNEKAFSYFSNKERPGKIRETNTGKSLNLTFSTLPTLILTINLHAYNGAETYVGGGKFKLINFKDPKAVFKNEDDSKLIINEDDEAHLKGSISFATVSEKNEEIVINATFNLTKVVIDLNNQDALLKEIKENPSVIQSLGDLKSDKDFILKSISINPLAFKYAEKSLKGDRDFILKALQGNRKNFMLLMHADKDIKSDKDFALKAVKINKLALHFLDKKLKKDKDIIAASKLK